MRPHSLLVFGLALVACSAAEPAAPPVSSGRPSPSASASAAVSKAEPHEDPAGDPNESPRPIVMEVLVPKDTPKAKFPKATVGDKDCWKDMPLTGDHQKDWDKLIGLCGAATGMLEYAKPKTGRLHHKHDPRDTFVLKVHKGQCYRVFAVGDGSVQDMDIRITKPNGALLEDDKTDSPAAIIHNAGPWCADDDEDLHFTSRWSRPAKAITSSAPGSGPGEPRALRQARS